MIVGKRYFFPRFSVIFKNIRTALKNPCFRGLHELDVAVSGRWGITKSQTVKCNKCSHTIQITVGDDYIKTKLIKDFFGNEYK